MLDILKGKTILITGGTGFIGRALIKEILKYEPARIRILSRDEVKHHNVQQMFNNDLIGHFIGDIRDYPRLLRATKGADIVIHAAALKRVDMIEYNVEEAIKTNIIGSLNIVRACIENNVEKVLFISTDKSCSPVNTYGACKFVSERIFTESNYSKGSAKTNFICVRYGNVLESTGSVLPFFTEKIKKGEPIPLTDERMTRFAITSDQAVELIFNAIRYGVGGEVFVPKIPSHKVTDLIEILKEKYNPNHEVKIIGIRPGEKIHELMINDTEMARTIEFKDLYIINSCIVNPWMANKTCEYAKDGKKVDLNKMKEYSSKDNIISKEELKKILNLG
jgi:FlaA1/EpsC-like NDP-sugar epimerase